jgi:uncharacterized protein (TIGR02246 family)
VIATLLDAYAALFTEDATYITFVATRYQGRRAIAESHRALWAKFLKGTRLDDQMLDVRFCGPGAAVVTSRGDTSKGKQAPRKLNEGPEAERWSRRTSWYANRTAMAYRGVPQHQAQGAGGGDLFQACTGDQTDQRMRPHGSRMMPIAHSRGTVAHSSARITGKENICDPASRRSPPLIA